MIALLAMLVLTIPIWFCGDVYTFFSEISTTSLLKHKTTMGDIRRVGENIYSIHQLQIYNKGQLDKVPMIKLDHLYCELKPGKNDVISLDLVECNYGDIYILADSKNNTNITKLPIDMPPRLLMNNIRVHINTIGQKKKDKLVVSLDGYMLLDNTGHVDDLSFRLTTIDGKLLLRVEKNPTYDPSSILPSDMLPYILKDFSIINIMKCKEAGKILKYWPAMQDLLKFIKH